MKDLQIAHCMVMMMMMMMVMMKTTTTSSSDVTPRGPCVCTAPSVTDESPR